MTKIEHFSYLFSLKKYGLCMQDKLKYSISFRILLVLLSKNTDSECKICSNYWESILDKMEYSIPVTDFALACKDFNISWKCPC
jgi:hypothetical protein